MHAISLFLARLIIAALAIVSTVTISHANELNTAISGLTSDDFSETETAITAIVTIGTPQAALVLEALGERRLVFDSTSKTVFIKSGDTLNNAATNEIRINPPADLEQVKVNNRIRRALEAASGSLILASPDPKKRIQGADSIFKTRDAKQLALVERSLSTETNPQVRKSLESARAAILAFDPAAPEKSRLDAIDTLKSTQNQDMVALLRSVPAGGSEEVKAKINKAALSIEEHLRLLNYAQNIWFGLSLGSVLLLAAIGLAITFGVMGIINMAHGEMVMLGAYTVFVVQEYIFKPYFPSHFDWSLPVAIPLAFLVAACVGILIERGIIRFLYGRPLETLLATWGVSLLLQQATRTIFGANNREVSSPSYMSGSFDFLGLQITYGRLCIVGFALIVFVALLLVLRATSFGLKMRAVTQNRRMAAAMGIRTPRIDMFAFALGSGIAGIAGVALSQIDNVSPNLGQNYIVDSFMVVVFGGVGNLWGTFVAAFSLGITNKFLEPFAGAVLAKILVLIFIILFIQKRPRGLFALKGRAIEQ
jgi:urea transport system permease protein